MFFAKTQMGWTVAKRPKLVCDPIDGENVRRLENKIDGSHSNVISSEEHARLRARAVQ